MAIRNRKENTISTMFVLVAITLLLTHAQSTLVAETVHEHARISAINKNFKSTTETFVSSRSNIIIVQLLNII